MTFNDVLLFETFNSHTSVNMAHINYNIASLSMCFFCTIAQQLIRYQLTWCVIAWSLCESHAVHVVKSSEDIP